MPLPKPKKGEKRDDFVQRCMGDSVMKSEYPKQGQRLAVCNSLFKDKKSKSRWDEF